MSAGRAVVKLSGMGLRRWGAVAASALVMAGCGSTVSGQALPISTVQSSSVVSPATTAATGSSSTVAAATSTGMTPFPDPSISGTAQSSASTSSAPTVSTPTPSTPTPSPTTAAPSTTVKWLLPLPKGGGEKINKFGNVVATPGQSFAVQWRSNKRIAVVFIVDSLQVDRGCEVQVKASNGHLVVISMRAQLGYTTGRELSDEAIGFTDSFWTAFDAKDTAQVGVDSSAASTCVTYKTQVPYADDMEPDKVYSGKIALDVSSATGSVVLMNSLDGGWLYRYG